MSDRQLLRDRYGTIIGQLITEGSKQTLRDRYGYLLGWYNTSNDLTHDKYGTIIGQGNILLTLLK